jgi:hypothetical protein
MGRVTSTGFVLLILVAGMSSCTSSAMAPPVVSVQQECERSGGIWRTGFCERASGGGGY